MSFKDILGSLCPLYYYSKRLCLVRVKVDSCCFYIYTVARRLGVNSQVYRYITFEFQIYIYIECNFIITLNSSKYASEPCWSTAVIQSCFMFFRAYKHILQVNKSVILAL